MKTKRPIFRYAQFMLNFGQLLALFTKKGRSECGSSQSFIQKTTTSEPINRTLILKILTF